MKSLKYLLLAAVLAGAGCSDDTTANPGGQMSTPDGGGSPDGGGTTTPDGGATNPDGGGATPDVAGATTLAEFVIDLVNNKTNETGTPVSVDDKTLTDTMDPAAFDRLF